MTTGTALGTVKWYNPRKGYGFIAPDGGQEDVFFHESALGSVDMGGNASHRAKPGRLNLAEGQRVRFESERAAKGLQAKAVRSV
ncbi:MAG TPA: cold shock domain-containing protein [Acidimicrobiales bacterium]|nr:cold shock domain-containing protein [Acidimicrobiales bacterium]